MYKHKYQDLSRPSKSLLQRNLHRIATLQTKSSHSGLGADQWGETPITLRSNDTRLP